MKEKILNQLKTKYKHFGFSDEVMDGVAAQLSSFVKEETEIEPSVNGAESLLKTFQKYADSRVNSFKTESEKNKAEAESLKKKLAELEKPEENQDSLSALMAQLKSLSDAVTNLTTEKTHTSLTQKFTEMVKDVPEYIYKPALFGRQFKDENEVSQLAEHVKSEYERGKQENANQQFPDNGTPEGGSNASESKAIADMIDKGTREKVEELKSKN